MERLTEYVTENCSKPFYRFRSDGEIDIRYRYCINIEKAIDKLAEYENTGLEPKEINQLNHDLALYKTAFGNVLSDADEKINIIYRNDCCCSVEMENSKFYLAQAEKELKGEK